MSGVPSLNSVYHALDLLGEDHKSVTSPGQLELYALFLWFQIPSEQKEEKEGEVFYGSVSIIAKTFFFSDAFVPKL